MARDPWWSPRAILTLVALPIVTALAIFVVYGEWDLLSYGDLFWRTIHRFPWVRFSLLMTLITSLAAVAGAHRRSVVILGSPIMYGFVVIPFVLLLTHPGPEALGRFSDPGVFHLIWMLAITHAVGFHQLRRAVEEAEQTEQQASGGAT